MKEIIIKLYNINVKLHITDTLFGQNGTAQKDL